MLDGWIIAGSYGSTLIRWASISARMSRSERSTRAPYRRGAGPPACRSPAGRRQNRPMPFHRYVALGDSFAEGVGDPDPASPNGLRGWADRVAAVLARETSDFGYANLAVRGRKLDAVVAEQLEPAVALRPDLVTIYAGANDIMRPRVDIDALVDRYDAALGKLASTGAHLLVFTAFDTGGSAIYRPVRARFALYNE